MQYKKFLAAALGTLVTALALMFGTPTAGNAVVTTHTAAAASTKLKCHTDFFTDLPTLCVSINGSGLRVNYVTVHNGSGSSGIPYISNSGDHITHHGPRIVSGKSWTFHYNRNLKNGSQVCGSINHKDTKCFTIHR